MDFRFGNPEAMLKGLQWIAFRKNRLHDLLPEGVKIAGEKIGKGSEKYTLHIKGQELPMHDPRGKTGQGISFVLSLTGADYFEVYHDTPFAAPGPIMGLLEAVPARDLGPKKIRNYNYFRFVWFLYNSLGSATSCRAGLDPRSQQTDGCGQRAGTGWKTSLRELLKRRERTVTMARVFNLREGFGRKDDTLPDRLFEPWESDPPAGQGDRPPGVRGSPYPVLRDYELGPQGWSFDPRQAGRVESILAG
jgi:aldehyde:ferredoxin oxidoreductase